MDIMISRNPIFDAGEGILGYELSHHSAEPGSTEHSVLDALLEIGIDRVAKQGVAFLNTSREVLLTGAVELFHPQGVVFVLDGALLELDLLRRCQELRGLGYHFALDVDPAIDPPDSLLDLSEVARIRVDGIPPERLEEMARMLRKRGLHLLALGVENTTVRDLCLKLGFRMFLGFRFNQPEVLEKQELSIEHLDTFRLLKDIRNSDVPDKQIIDSFHKNPNLTYKLLRVVNTAAIGGAGIDSIGHAVRLMGREALGRWLSLLLLSSIAGSGVSAEISSSAIMRALLCERLADVTGRPWAQDSLFTVGLFSRLDLLLNTSLEHILEQISFTENVKNALLAHTGPDGAILALVEAYEAAQWDEVRERSEELGIDPSILPSLYLDSLPASGGDEKSAGKVSARSAAAILGTPKRDSGGRLMSFLSSFFRRAS